MKHKKPIKLVRLVKDKLLDTQRGFVESWNWICDQFEDEEENKGSVEIVGTDGSSATCTGKLTFQSASDSNVKVSVSDDGEGNATVTIGVYWK